MSRTPMKLILTQEVTGLGAPGDVVEVAGGYGRNYLVPRGLAMRWTRGAEKQIDLIKRARAARDIRGLDDARDTASALAALTVRLPTSAGSRYAPRSRPSGRIRSRSACTPRSAPRSISRSPPPEPGPPPGWRLPASPCPPPSRRHPVHDHSPLITALSRGAPG